MSDRDMLLLDVAILYYRDGMTQNEGAKKLHISRPSVSNLLKEARERGIVKISIHHPNTTFISKTNLAFKTSLS